MLFRSSCAIDISKLGTLQIFPIVFSGNQEICKTQKINSQLFQCYEAEIFGNITIRSTQNNRIFQKNRLTDNEKTKQFNKKCALLFTPPDVSIYYELEAVFQ